MERSTRQRAAILHVLEQTARPVSPRELLAAARREVPGIGMATVYRALAALVADAAVRAVELPGEPARYEPAGLAHHHHFHCAKCQRVYDIAGCPKGIAAVAPRGFLVDRHELVLYGTCRQCRAA